MKKTEQDIIAEAVEAHLAEAKEVHQVLIDGKLESSHSSEEDAKKRIKQLAFDYKHRTKEPFMAGGKDKKPKIEIKKSIKESVLTEANKSSIGYSNEPGENEVNVLKAHGNRHLVMKGQKTGGMLGHVDRIPNVNMADMSSDPSKDGHHAYGVKYRKGKHGIMHSVTHRLGEFPSHEEAVAAVKKFHKINESILSESKLKMDPAHYAELKNRISGLADKIPGHVEAVRKSGKFKDLGKRVRFDVLHATKLHDDHDLYANGVNDDHLDSALKSAFKELNIKDS